jgi:hypothetical protein
MKLIVIDIAQRVAGPGAQRITIKNTGAVIVYFGRTAETATAADGLPVEASEGLWIDGPVWAACAEGLTGEIRYLLPS